MAAHVRASSCCCRTATRARARSIPPPGRSGSCRCAPPTTGSSPTAPRPANYFHILRRQMHRSFRKPLILMTPKSLLRHKLAVSKLKDFAKGSSFHRLLWDDADLGPEYGISSTKLVPDEKIKRVVLCSGQGLLRPARGARRPRHRRRLPDAARAVLPVPGAVADQGARPLQAGADHLVPGGAEEPGRLDLRRAQPRMGAGPDRRQAYPRPSTSAAPPPPRPPPGSPASTRRSRRRWSTPRSA